MGSHCACPFERTSSFQHLAKQGREELLTAAVERGPSQAARSGSKESSSRPCATPSETARCTSRGGSSRLPSLDAPFECARVFPSKAN